MEKHAWVFVSGAIPRPEVENNAAEWAIADRKAKADLILPMSPSKLKHIERCNTSQGVYDKLNSIIN